MKKLIGSRIAVPAQDKADIKRYFAKSLAEKFIYEKTYGEPLPPWLKHPEILIGSMGWRMGIGEAYLVETATPAGETQAKTNKSYIWKNSI